MELLNKFSKFSKFRLLVMKSQLQKIHFKSNKRSKEPKPQFSITVPLGTITIKILVHLVNSYYNI
jgi:hypothetical protein